MKTLLVSLLLSSAAMAAAPNALFCGGQDADGSNVQIVVNVSAKTIELNREDRSRGGMPPYAFINEQNWKLQSFSTKNGKISAAGRTVGFTTGRAGTISLSVTGVNTAWPQVYGGKVSIQKPMRVLRPSVAEVISVSCRVK